MSDDNNECESSDEPWGRYSASGGVYDVDGVRYFYSFGGDTRSNADGGGGVVRTNFRFNFDTKCWERLVSSPIEIGYRGTATQVTSDLDHVFLLFGGDRQRDATNQFYKYSLLKDSWTELTTSGIDTPHPRWKHAAVSLDDTRILIVGGRDGTTVRSDAWMLDRIDLSWTFLETNGMPPLYRHGMALDPTRNVVWITGGLGGAERNYSRYDNGQIWTLDLETLDVNEIRVADTTNTNPQLPPRMASHSMEYLSEPIDALLLWSGSCNDEAELHVFDCSARSWCRIFPEHRPDRRDAQLWSLRYPNFYVATGDSICYNRQVLPIADVHVINLQSLERWEMLYEPTNQPRGTGNEPYCDGTNAGFCQPRPLFPADSTTTTTGKKESTCSPELLARFTNGTSSLEESTASSIIPEEMLTSNNGTQQSANDVSTALLPPSDTAPTPTSGSCGIDDSSGKILFVILFASWFLKKIII